MHRSLSFIVSQNKIKFVIFLTFSLSLHNCVTTHVEERKPIIIDRKTENIGQPFVVEEKSYPVSLSVMDDSLYLTFESVLTSTTKQKQIEKIEQSIERSAFTEDGNIIYAFGNMKDPERKGYGVSVVLSSILSLGVQVVWTFFDFVFLPFRSIDRTENVQNEIEVSIKGEKNNFKVPKGSTLTIGDFSLSIKKNKVAFPLNTVLHYLKEGGDIEAILNDPQSKQVAKFILNKEEVQGKIDKSDAEKLREFVFRVPENLKEEQGDSTVRREPKKRKLETLRKAHNERKARSSIAIRNAVCKGVTEEQIETIYGKRKAKELLAIYGFANFGEIVGKMALCEECYTKTGRFLVDFEPPEGIAKNLSLEKLSIEAVTANHTEAAEFQIGKAYSLQGKFKEFKLDSPTLVIEP